MSACRVGLALLVALGAGLAAAGCGGCGAGRGEPVAGSRASAAPEEAHPAARAARDGAARDGGGAVDAGPSAGGAEGSGPAPAGPRPFAWGRLVVDLPEGFARRPADAGPPCDPAEVAAEDCLSLERDGRLVLGLCASPTHVLAEHVEALARRHLERNVLEGRGEVEVVPVEGTHPALRLLRARPADAVDSLATHGTFPLAALFFVAHPDGTSLVLEVFRDGGVGEAEALALADRVARSLAPGPVTVTRGAGRRTLRFGSGPGRLGLDAPDGFLAVWEEGIDSWGFDIAPPAGVDVEAPRLSLGFHNSFDPDEPEDGFTGRRRVGLFGREVELRSRVDRGVTILRHQEVVPELDATLYVELRAAPGRALDRLVAALESADLEVDRTVIEERDPDDGEARRTCGHFVVEPRSPLNVRASPAADGAVVGSLPDGTLVEVSEQRGGWLRLTSPLAGWAWARSVRRQCVHR